MSHRFFKEFSLLGAGLLVGITLLLGAGITYLVEQRMLEEATLASLDYFRNLARFITTKEEFVQLRTGEQYEAFDRLIRETFFTPRVVTIKIYDRSGMTIYHSRNREIVGRAFPDNAALQRALQGETVIGLSDLRGAEHLAERQAGYTRLLEVYIPILLEGTSSVIGAYEIYSPIDPLYQKVWSLRFSVWASVVFGLALLYGALWVIFGRASHTIVQQNVTLERAATELRAAYDQLRQAQSQLVQSEKLASTGQLAAGMVHELGNPLGSVLGLLDLQLLCGARPEDRAECRDRTERIAGEIVRLRRILQGLLDYARPSPPQPVPVNVNAAVEKTVQLAASHKEFKGIAWTKALAAPAPLAVADEHLLEQVLLNVLLNAAQATAEGGSIRVETGTGRDARGTDDEARVGRGFSPDEDAVILTIEDQGPGIPSDQLERVFEPFFSTKPRGKGSGLGLAICHRLIDILQGSLVISSPPGRGTTVRVLLAISSADRAPEPTAVESARND